MLLLTKRVDWPNYVLAACMACLVALRQHGGVVACVYVLLIGHVLMTMREYVAFSRLCFMRQRDIVLLELTRFLVFDGMLFIMLLAGVVCSDLDAADALMAWSVLACLSKKITLIGLICCDLTYIAQMAVALVVSVPFILMYYAMPEWGVMFMVGYWLCMCACMPWLINYLMTYTISFDG